MEFEEFLQNLLYKEVPNKSKVEVSNDIELLIDHGIKEIFAKVSSKAHKKDFIAVINQPQETNRIMQGWYNQLVRFCKENKIPPDHADVFLDIGLLYKYIKKYRLSSYDCARLSEMHPRTWRELIRRIDFIKNNNPYLTLSVCKRLVLTYTHKRKAILKIMQELRKEHRDWSAAKLLEEAENIGRKAGKQSK